MLGRPPAGAELNLVLELLSDRRYRTHEFESGLPGSQIQI